MYGGGEKMNSKKYLLWPVSWQRFILGPRQIVSRFRKVGRVWRDTPLGG